MLTLTIIGGYLGSGKTTLVNHLLRNADGLRIAVLVNEFGALPIDHDLIESQNDNVISIAGGCVCCSYGNDLIHAMMDLAKLKPRPDHVLLEASGVALPGAVASSISLMQDYQLEGIVVLANAETIKDLGSDRYVADTIERQLADANILLLNKCDLATSDELQDTIAWLAPRTGNAELVQSQFCSVPKELILQSFPTERPVLNEKADHQVGIFATRFLPAVGIFNAEAIAQNLARKSLSLIRAKGFIETETGMKTIQTVGRRWAVSNAPETAQPGLVVIALAAELDFGAVLTALSETHLCDDA